MTKVKIALSLSKTFLVIMDVANPKEFSDAELDKMYAEAARQLAETPPTFKIEDAYELD